MLVVLGVPLLYMELTLGQYTRRGPVHALATVCPLLKGTQSLNKYLLLKCIQTKQSKCSWLQTFNPLVLVSVHRSGHCISSHLLHHEHLLQSRHHLGPLLSVQLFPGPSAMGELQQHLEHTTLCQSGLNEQQQLLYSQPRILQVLFMKWEKPLLCLSVDWIIRGCAPAIHQLSDRASHCQSVDLYWNCNVSFYLPFCHLF